MPFNVFNRRLGVRHGRLQPVNHSPSNGAWTMVLGSDAESVVVNVKPNDAVTATQTVVTAGEDLFRLLGAIRVPASMPAGYSWAVETLVDAVVVRSLLIPSGVYEPGRFVLDDWGGNISQVAPGSHALGVRLRLEGPGSATVAVELPALYLDAVELAAKSNVFLYNRLPSPLQTDVPQGLTEVRLSVSSTTGTTIDLSNTTITIEGVVAYTSGTFQAGFSGTAVLGGNSNTDAIFAIDISGASFQPLTTEQVIDVRVQSETTGGADTIDETYTFTVEDLARPQLTAAVPINEKVLRVSFNEPVLMTAGTFGALNPANYALEIADYAAPEGVKQPAVTANVVSVAQHSSSVVELTFDTELTQRARYVIRSLNVIDLNDNSMDLNVDRAEFAAFRCTKPGRRFEVLDFIPDMNIREDATGDLRKWSLILQDIVDLLLCDIDHWSNIIDLELADEEFLDHILWGLGNPFPFANELSLIDKRRLARLLIDIYRQKGTAKGVINAIRFFLGIDVTILIVNDDSAFWKIGRSLLGTSTVLGPGPGSPLWYSWRIVSPIDLMPEQRSRMLEIATYMKPAHEHILGINEPSGVVMPSLYWILGTSTLGVDTTLSG